MKFFLLNIVGKTPIKSEESPCKEWSEYPYSIFFFLKKSNKLNLNHPALMGILEIHIKIQFFLVYLFKNFLIKKSIYFFSYPEILIKTFLKFFNASSINVKLSDSDVDILMYIFFMFLPEIITLKSNGSKIILVLL